MNADATAFLQGAVGVIFLTAALAKIIYSASITPFLLAVGIRPRATSLLSRGVPALEGLVGVMLVLGVLSLPASVTGTLLSLAFCAVLVVARRIGVQEGCRCFGPLDSQQMSVLPVARAALLGVASLTLSVRYLHDPVVSSSLVWRWFPTAALFGIITGAGFITAFALLEQVWLFEQGRLHAVPSPKQGGVDVGVPL